jgi:hypothetical protein
VSVNAAYLHDLELCARRVYELLDDLAEQRVHLSLDRIFDRDRRLVIGLTGQLLASIALIPWLGAGIVLAGLAILYVGALGSAAWAMMRVQRARESERLDTIDAAVRQAISTCPPLDAGAAALVIRVANLAAITPNPRSVAMLRATLHEAAARPELKNWPFLDDVAVLVEGATRRVTSGQPGI